MGKWSSKAAEIMTAVADQITDLAKPSPPSPEQSNFVDMTRVADAPKAPDHSRGMGE